MPSSASSAANSPKILHKTPTKFQIYDTNYALPHGANFAISELHKSEIVIKFDGSYWGLQKV
jgi:hypothetical protein